LPAAQPAPPEYTEECYMVDAVQTLGDVGYA
jgi:hypothetical protein